MRMMADRVFESAYGLSREDWEKHVPRLSEFGPATLVVNDPDNICVRDVGKHRFMLDMHFRNWEMKSPVARARVGAVTNAG